MATGVLDQNKTETNPFVIHGLGDNQQKES
jgi:hypothetical protein